MSRISATFTGSVVAEPESRMVGSSNILEFPVYVNHQRKNKDTQQYEKTGDVSKIRVTLWREAADSADVRKGDLVEVTATLVEKEFDKKDGTKGRSLQTEFVDSVVLKARRDADTPAGSGFEPADTGGGF
jgi:single-stranded DNA-binding protein